MIIEKKLITELKPAPYNPRQSTKEQEKDLKASLEKFWLVEPIIYNKQTWFIVWWHFRLRELKKLWYKEVECVIVDLPPEEERELNIRLNANTWEWDYDLLANEFDIWELEEWGLDIPWVEDVEELEAKEDDFEIDEEIKTDIIKGDLFTFYKDWKELHRLLCWDSTKINDVEKLMWWEKADMVFTDPPYWISMSRSLVSWKDNSIKNDNWKKTYNWIKTCTI